LESAPNFATSSGLVPSSAALSGVHTGPGDTTLTRMPFSISCCARTFEYWLIAPLVAE
jgi:hypothetical protein